MKKEKIIGLAALALMLTTGASVALAGNFNSDIRKAEMEQKRVEMQTIFENGNYDEWVNLSNQNLEEKIVQMRERHQERISQITAENWARFAEAHQLMAAGDIAGARVIMEELGLEKGLGQGMGIMKDEMGMGHFNKGDRGQGFGRGGRNSDL